MKAQHTFYTGNDMNYGHELKKIIFEDTDKKHADLKIRLYADGLAQGEFFRMIVDGYVDRDDRIVDFVEECKEEKNIQSKQKRAKSKKIHNKANKVIKKFALSEREVENIFNLLEKENPEL